MDDVNDEGTPSAELINEVRERSAASGIAIPAERLEEFARSVGELRVALEPLRRHAGAKSIRTVFGGVNDPR
ncbi:MAG TPA: hypothetical protein VGM83_06990 [Devosiaceae bacterium]|jgi:hypothetical protein